VNYKNTGTAILLLLLATKIAKKQSPIIFTLNPDSPPQ